MRRSRSTTRAHRMRHCVSRISTPRASNSGFVNVLSTGSGCIAGGRRRLRARAGLRPRAWRSGAWMAEMQAFLFRVRYGDTDQMGFAYYAHYLRWFEVGRAELMR